MAIDKHTVKRFAQSIEDKLLAHLTELNESYDAIEGKEKLDLRINSSWKPGKTGNVQVKGGISFAPHRVRDSFEFVHDPTQGKLGFLTEDENEKEPEKKGRGRSKAA